jgi:hypothetical protein
MAAKKSKKVTVEVDIEVLKKLVEAVEALTELASAHIQGSDDPRVRALGGKGKAGRAKKKSRR